MRRLEGRWWRSWFSAVASLDVHLLMNQMKKFIFNQMFSVQLAQVKKR